MSVHRSRVLAWLPALAYMVLIWVVSSLPRPLRFAVKLFPFQDKGIHFVEYALLAALLAHAVHGTWPAWRIRSAFVVVWASTVMWGLLDEIHQAFVPGRIADVRDLIADAAGGLIGAVIYFALRQRKRRSVQPEPRA